jgi:hypothetical protein
MKKSITLNIGALFFVSAFAISTASADNLTVDLSVPIGPENYCALGFLHGITGTSPLDSMLTPLKIQVVRGAPNASGTLPAMLQQPLFSRLVATGAQFALGVYYPFTSYSVPPPPGDTNTYYYPGDNGNWTTWETIVGNTVDQATAMNCTPYWGIWGEPDMDSHFGWTTNGMALFDKTWSTGYATIRAHSSNAVITGPTMGAFSAGWMETFLYYCRANNCIPDIVTWHENSPSNTSTQIVADVQTIRTFCTQQHIAIKGIAIDEYGAPAAQYLPGPMVEYIAALEQAQVTYAVKSIWIAPGTLSGATTADGTSPTSLWWMYKAYGDMSGNAYAVASTGTTTALASATADDSLITVLVGNPSASAVSANLILNNIGQNKEFTVTPKLISNSNQNALEAPQTLPRIKITTSGSNSPQISLGTLPGYGAMEVVIRRTSR